MLLGALGCLAGLLLAGSGRSEAAPAPPNASFTYAPADPFVGQTVKFTSTSTPAKPDNPITNYKWDLDGNGSFETDTGPISTVSRSYGKAGSITVKLQVTDLHGRTDDAQGVVTIGNKPPVASFSYAPGIPVVNEPVTFTSTATDPEGRIAELAWDLNGDGSYDNGVGLTVLRTFAYAGSYVVGLRVTDSAGAVSFVAGTILVVAPGQPVSQKAKAVVSLMSPFPLVRIAGRITRDGTRLRLLRIEAPKGARVAVRCSGRGCPFANQVRLAGRGPEARAAARIRVKRLERLLRPGVTIRIFVTRSDAIGKYTRFRIRRGRAPARIDRCLEPSSRVPIRCPSA
jgi:PKD repeat protein